MSEHYLSHMTVPWSSPGAAVWLFLAGIRRGPSEVQPWLAHTAGSPRFCRGTGFHWYVLNLGRHEQRADSHLTAFSLRLYLTEGVSFCYAFCVALCSMHFSHLL